jgi:CheY-like chemotaxis protein
MVSAVLHEEGVPHAVASAGREALAAVLAYRPPVVLFDPLLPDLAGAAFARLVRGVLGRAVYLVAYSADVTAPAELASQVEADAYLLKPFALADLMAILRGQAHDRQDGRYLLAARLLDTPC